MRLFVTAVVLSALFLSSCAKQEGTLGAGAPQATVLMRDGTTVSGAVASSSTTEVKVTEANGTTRTIPMSQVRSIEYGEPVPAPAASTSPGTTPPPAAARPATAPPAQTAAKPRRAPAPDVTRVTPPRPVEAEITSKTLVLPVGTELSVRTAEAIDSSKAVDGQTFAADVTSDVLDSSGDVVIPRGSNAQITIVSASKGGKITGASDLVLDLATVSVDGRAYQISTTDVEQKGKAGLGANKRTGVFTGGGAAVGAIIGAIAGGGKGAAIGAGVGAASGAAGQVLTKGSIKIPVETVLTFKLDKPLRVTPAKPGRSASPRSESLQPAR